MGLVSHVIVPSRAIHRGIRISKPSSARRSLVYVHEVFVGTKSGLARVLPYRVPNPNTSKENAPLSDSQLEDVDVNAYKGDNLKALAHSKLDLHEGAGV